MAEDLFNISIMQRWSTRQEIIIFKYKAGMCAFKCRCFCLWQQDKNSEAPVRIKKSTGIPRSFMVEVDDPNIKGAKLTNCGRYAIPAIDAWVLIKVLLCVFINVSFVWPLGNTFIYTFLRVCLQKCIYYPWHRLNQVLETFLCPRWHDSITLGCRSVDCTSMMWICCLTTCQRCFTGLCELIVMAKKTV